MADKKVERSGRERPRTPTQKMNAALSDPGTMSMADPTHDKGKSALVDRFRDREQRWRTEQSLRDREAAHGVEHAAEHVAEDAAEAVETAEAEGPGEGGES
jgi:hypothetical protein